ncbi:MAG: RNA methyltransferase [Desulfamplus sp.]|nr:RNA methyltransferase [Desulfamplus sp.]MBF0258048.1 RNA methyltransferase [Desulfamplus sp.]
MALIHHPVSNKKGSTIASALTTIDMHDIARASMTFGVRGFYVVTPLMDQQVLAHEVIDHWTEGIGGELNPFRKRALELIRVVSTFEDALQDIKADCNQPVVTVATSAAKHDKTITTAEFAEKLLQQRGQQRILTCEKLSSCASHLIAFGTAWGLSQEFISNCDFILEPVYGIGVYNHLSVRSAVSIILDRICRNLPCGEIQ